MKKATGLSNQIILYAKHHYGKSNDIYKDIYHLIMKYCGHVPSKNDVLEAIIFTYAHYGTENKIEVYRALREALIPDPILNRKPIEILLGHLAITSGEIVDMSQKENFNFRKK